MKNKQLWLVGLVLVMLVAGLGLSMFRSSSQTFQDHQLVRLQIGGQTLKVEVVNSPQSITQGLSGRDQVGSDGMLFIFPQAKQASFWMKEMKFDLDVVWLADSQVVAVTKDVPHPAAETPLTELPTYSPPKAVEMVLEVPSGTADKFGWQPGTPITVSNLE